MNYDDLMCPITMDWLEDPITLPCCGRTVSREPMVEWMNQSNTCPACNQQLNNFNPQTCPKSINIAYLVEKAKNEGAVPELFKPKPKSESKWVAQIHKLCNNDSIFQTIIGKLVISNTDNKYQFKTLLLPVIDRSGSMAGNPNNQARYSLHRILDMTYKHSQLLTTMISYADNAQHFEIDTSMPQALFRDSIDKIVATGGTSFRSAFTEIINVVKKHVNNNDISSMVIIFLTDGEDSSVVKEKRKELVDKLQADLKKIWNKEFVIHSIGFGGQHDYDFLNNLRQIGTVEGAYRYADPSEDSDSLSNKINSLLDVITASSTIPLKIKESPVPILSGDNCKYWVELTGHEGMPEFEIVVNDQEAVKIQSEFAEDENDPKIWEEWYTQLVDEIANEILMLSSGKIDSLDKEIHCELLQQRSKAIMMKMDSTSSNANRLEKLCESLTVLQKGGSVNQSKLNDMKFEGKYATKSSGQPKVVAVNNNPGYSTTAYIIPVIKKPKLWEVIEKKRVRRCNARDSAKQCFIVLGRYAVKNAVEWFTNNTASCKDDLDDNGSNVLMVACSIGKYSAIKVLLESGLFNLNQTNKEGYNALDLAVIYGYDRVYDLMTSHGAKTSVDGQLLLRTCLSVNDHKRSIYSKVASRLLKDKVAVITDDMIENCPVNEGVEWLSARSSKGISIETAIRKGMIDIVTEQLNTVDKISWKQFPDLFTKPTNEHHAIVELLLQNKKADPNEIYEITEEDNTKGTSWPLYDCCEKGQVSMFKLLLKYIDKGTLNRQNHHGTTCLWIASCNRHIDIVMELLHLGADPNVPNAKGDGPLIPAIQKGNDSIVELLLESGAKMSVYNQERDGPVLNACRTGQAKILETLFKQLSKEDLEVILDTYHPIDGFVPLLASVELDKVECAKICYKFGADLETRTADDNKVIAGATALHLAVFYNRLASAKCLVDLGADVKALTTVGGFTPLHIAIKQNHPHMVRYLLGLPEGKECLNICDSDNRIPAFYAKNNPEILDEFFTNKLALMLNNVILSNPEMEEKCATVLRKYGRAPSLYEYDFTETDLGDGTSLLTHALLNGNKKLIEELCHMNADLYKKDDYGVNAIFWAQFLNYKIEGAEPDEQSVKMIDNVFTSMKKSMQNKLLLNVQVGQPKLLEAPPGMMEPIEKMSNGYSLKINDTVINNLKSLKSIDHSLLGFIEKLKNNKIFPDGKNVLEHLLFEAKVHVIKLIAGGESTLDAPHLMAIYLHSSNPTIFKQINQSLMNYKPNDVWQPFLGCLYSGLHLIKPLVGECYRAVDTQFNMMDLALGKTLKWNSFSIASQEFKSCNDLLNKKRGIVFIVQSKTGRPINAYEKNQTDKTVVFLPGTSFVVKGYIKPSLMALCQSNIRQSTFKITDKDIENSINGKSCIIVELEEL